MGRLAECAVLAAFTAGASAVVSIANLAGSLRILDLTGSALLLSITVLAYNLAFTLMSWFWPAIFVGRLKRRGLLASSTAGMGAGLLAMGLSPNPYIVILGSGVAGAFSALIYPVMVTVLADYYGKDSVAVTRYNTLSSVGFIVGYVAAAAARVRIGTAEMLVITAATSLALTALTALMPQRYVVVEPRRVSYVSLIPQLTGRLRPVPSLILTPKVVYNLRRLAVDFARMVARHMQRRLPLTLLATAVLFTAIGTFFTPMPAFLRSVGLNDVEVYVIYLISSVVSTVAYRFIHPLISDSWRAWRLLTAAVAARAPLFLLPTYVILLNGRVEPFAVAAAGFVIVGITWAAISSSLTAVILFMAEKERKEERLGHLNAMIGVGTILGSLIAGPIAQEYGYVALSATASALVAIASALYYRAMKALVT